MAELAIGCKDTESKTLCSHFIKEIKLGLELASTSFQSLLQEESNTIDLLSIQIDKSKVALLVETFFKLKLSLSFIELIWNLNLGFLSIGFLATMLMNDFPMHNFKIRIISFSY